MIYYLYLCIGIWQCHTHSLPMTVFPSPSLSVAYHALPFAMLCAVLCATCGTLRDTSMINCLSQVTFDILSYLLCFGYPHPPPPVRLSQLWLSKSLKCKFHSHCSATTTAISFSFSTKLTIKAFQFQLTLDMPLKLNALQSTSMRAVKVTNNVPLMLYDDQRRRRRIPGLKCLNSLANLWPQYANWGHVGSALV